MATVIFQQFFNIQTEQVATYQKKKKWIKEETAKSPYW